MQVISNPKYSSLNPLALSMKDLKWVPKTETSTEFKCIEGWSENISYAGIRFSDFMKQFNLGTRSGKAPDFEKGLGDLYPYVGFETPDRKYYVSLDMESLLHPQSVLAYELNGVPLTLKHGAPLRLVIPVKYGIKSLKRIGKIIFSEERLPDYWEERGYDWYSGL
jgi:DMSO/TMAO reductase YedYZ molybdopterin-dependent catalytic subunit